MVVTCMHYSSIATDNWHVRDIGTTWSYGHTDGETMRKIANKYFLKEKRKLARDKPFYMLGTNPEPHPHHCSCQDHVHTEFTSKWSLVESCWGPYHKRTCMMSWGLLWSTLLWDKPAFTQWISRGLRWIHKCSQSWEPVHCSATTVIIEVLFVLFYWFWDLNQGIVYAKQALYH